MHLSASLLQRQKQRMVLSPQAIEAIRLLRLTHTELHQLVEQALEKNPVLKPDPFDDVSPLPGEDQRSSQSRSEIGESPIGGPSGGRGQWKSQRSSGNDRPAVEEFTAHTETLHDHVARQVALTPFTPQERLIAGQLAAHLEDTGYLQVNLFDLAGRLNVRQADVERVIGILQQFDPPGIFARTLSECLEIQLRQQDRFDPAMAALVANLEMLARGDFQGLKQRCGVDEEDLLDMRNEIRALDPKPGDRFQSGTPETIVPDVWVMPSSEGGWRVELDPATLPKVLINHTYVAEISQLTNQNPEGKAFLDHCQEKGNWLISSLKQRAKTILKVATEIVRQQDDFLKHGAAHLRPLYLRNVAHEIDMHESTVSRVTSNRYMLTPRGVFELKYFFAAPIASCEGGDAHSAKAVRHRIKAIIAEESLDKVHSDEDIVAQLKETGIDVARRTVTKYREAMNIPSSIRRRREKRLSAAAIKRSD
ncbi:MAG: RNA polymerase sigma-54 factor [Mesorhizobium sp.]|uniref:RNA polymerase factor sigma-54 n=1 Tax=Mesorhizobium sp. TaxID=1871066 RepID=UPI000FE713F0|nr:RNA polymerase factor sigma-54 [Mesorhizobium sp.]RWE06756.1 MAG: RNA polymerase sigma-54 factor [Mesorhizobium sp.]RWI87057.1 MAG: RNA polymerase sigma-54 factor [Mesorhizobium sp.]TIM05440.1 MAG: RNA polymerase factor sigma-54 [Mesorhizobium sp.]